MKKIILIISFLIFITPVLADEKITVTLDKCVDGDTAWFNLNDESIKARFLAIDTPESTNKIEEYGKEASNYTCNLLTNASKIEIEYDKNSDKYDKYNRHLVWVYVDNELLQEKIIENGYGEVAYLYGDYEYTDSLKEKQEIAKENKLNIWSNEDTDNINYISIIIIIIVIIIYIFSKKNRKKINNKIKNTVKKQIKKEIKGILD